MARSRSLDRQDVHSGPPVEGNWDNASRRAEYMDANDGHLRLLYRYGLKHGLPGATASTWARLAAL